MKFQLLVGASVAALLAAGSAQAADKLKVGVLATLEGTYTVLGAVSYTHLTLPTICSV